MVPLSDQFKVENLDLQSTLLSFLHSNFYSGFAQIKSAFDLLSTSAACTVGRKGTGITGVLHFQWPVSLKTL